MKTTISVNVLMILLYYFLLQLSGDHKKIEEWRHEQSVLILPF